MIERSIGTPDVWVMEETAAEAPVRFEEFFDANVRLRMGEEALRRLRARPCA